MPTLPSYVLITPARNEAQFIELTIKSMLTQTVRPIKWVIVSDGSTDGMDGIVNRYAADHPWIELVRMPERSERHFAGKIHAFNAGYAKIKHMQYDVIGSLDGDTSFDENYFSFLLGKLAEDRTLGLVGTAYDCDSGPVYDYRFVNIDHVAGICQMFRRECFEQIGGYVPVKGGGVDFIAVLTARVRGWKTGTFTEKVIRHHRESGTAQYGALTTRFRSGVRDYAVGNHPAWELFRTAYHMTKNPFVIGGVAHLSGYLWALVRHADRPISSELVAFHRREQMQRLRKLLTGNRTREKEVLPRPPECA